MIVTKMIMIIIIKIFISTRVKKMKIILMIKIIISLMQERNLQHLRIVDPDLTAESISTLLPIQQTQTLCQAKKMIMLVLIRDPLSTMATIIRAIIIIIMIAI